MKERLEILLKYFPELSDNQIDRFGKLWAFYHDWNAKINLISRKDIDELYLKHVLHSLAIGKIVRFAEGTKILDIGTGGGFPGIPLSILFPGSKFHLVDSIGKKIKVVKEAIEILKLENATADQVRAEEVNEKFDFVVSRAVTDLSNFMKWIKGKVSSGSNDNFYNGVLYLKGGDLTDELSGIKWPYTIYNLNEIFEESFFETKKLIYLKKP